MTETVLDLCGIDPSDIATESIPFGPLRRYQLTHRPTGASASDQVKEGEPLSDSRRDDMLFQLAIEVLSRTMTEEKWDRCPDARPMLKFLDGRAGRRKLRLFACAMSRLSVSLIAGLDGAGMLLEAEDAADRGGNETGILLPNEDLQEYAAQNSIHARGRDAQRGEVEACHLLQRCRGDVAPFYQSEWLAAWHNAMFASEPFLWMDRRSTVGGQADQVAALRDIFGNPFRTLAFADPWRTTAVAEVARRVYEHRDVSSMPLLADALEEAGCDERALLDHCRLPGPHVRGCWAVDLVLRKQ